MRKATHSPMSRCGIPAATCGTALKNRNWSREPRDKEINANEKKSAGPPYHVLRSLGAGGNWSVCGDAEGPVPTGDLGAISASRSEREFAGLAIRRKFLSALSTGTGSGRRQNGGRRLLRHVPQHALHHDATATARRCVGSGSDENEEELRRDDPG